jgi:predicted amidohydrolase
MESTTVQWMRNVARSRKIVLGGSLMIAENGSYRNRFIWMLPNGGFSFYDKRHLFAYANEEAHYTPGDSRVIVSVNGWKIHLQVCYDLRFPAWARQQVRDGKPEYDVLVYVANWPERRIYAWKSLLVARAIENQCYVVGVNRVGTDGNGIQYNGQSMIIDPLGEVIAQGGEQAGMLEVSIKKDILEGIRQKFPFLHDADQVQILP